MSFKDDIKPYFVPNAYPTQDQFYELFEYLRWRDELIQAADLDPALLALLNSTGRTVQLPDGTMQFVAPAGTLIEKFFFGEQPGTLHVGAIHEYTVRVGTTVGGNELVADTVVDIDTPNTGILTLDSTGHYCLNATTIYFTTTPTVGEPNKPLIKIYKS